MWGHYQALLPPASEQEEEEASDSGSKGRQQCIRPPVSGYLSRKINPVPPGSPPGQVMIHRWMHAAFCSRELLWERRDGRARFYCLQTGAEKARWHTFYRRLRMRQSTLKSAGKAACETEIKPQLWDIFQLCSVQAIGHILEQIPSIKQKWKYKG